MKRILIVKLWALGDVLLATPLLRALKRQWPDCQISWLVSECYAEILRDNPLLEEVIEIDSRAWQKHFRYGQLAPYWRSQKLRRDLRSRNFDIVINLTAEKWWSIWFRAAPVQIGLFPRPRPGWMGRLYTKAVPRLPDLKNHNTVHYLRAAEALGIDGPFDQRLVMGVSEASRLAVDGFLKASADYDPAKPIIVLHPGTSQESKCWPTESYAALAKALTPQYTIIVTGSPQEELLAKQIFSALPHGDRKAYIIAAGRLTDLTHSAALIERAAALVTGDTSMLHIASALGTPLVGIYGSTRPGDNTPLFGPQRLLFDDAIPCAPCYQAHCPLKGHDFLRCQKAITTAQVLAALDKLLRTPIKSTRLPQS